MEQYAALDRLVARLYGQPIIRNVLRGELVEQFVLDALGDGWIAAGDWEAWDVQSVDGKHRIQVKQSAARQSWAGVDCKPSNARFSIKGSMAWTEAGGWAGDLIRQANFYIFAWHPLVDAAADHRDPDQWEFYVIASDRLPEQKSLSLSMVRAYCAPSRAGNMLATVSPMLSYNE
jgi:hypothetical protein